MKIKKIVRVLSLIALVIIVFACKKEDKPTHNLASNPFAAYTYSADYMCQMGEETVEGNCNGISVYPDAETDNSLVLFKGDAFSLTNMASWVFSGVGIPYNVGEELEIEYDTNEDATDLGFFNVGSGHKTFVATSGTLKREANNKITFSGMGALSGAVYDTISFSGYITSKAIELIKPSKISGRK